MEAAAGGKVELALPVFSIFPLAHVCVAVITELLRCILDCYPAIVDSAMSGAVVEHPALEFGTLAFWLY